MGRPKNLPARHNYNHMTKENILKVLGIVLLVVATTFVTVKASAGNVNAGGTTNFDDLGLNTLTVTGTSTLGSINLSGGLNVGGTAAANRITLIGAAAVTVPLQGLGPINTSTTSTIPVVLTVPVAGLSVGDPCSVGVNAGTSTPTFAFGYDFNLTTSSAASATGTLTMSNGSSTNIVVSTSTARILCVHLAL